MSFQICPRCSFRLPVAKHICSTCGYSFAAKKEAKPSPVSDIPKTVAAQTKPQPPRGFLKTLFGIGEEATKETRHEEPALGET